MSNIPPPPTGSPVISVNVTDGKKFTTAWLLSLLLGFFGADRFYLGKYGTALLKLFTYGGFGIWWIFDLISILNGKSTDKNGRPLVGFPENRNTQWLVTGAAFAFLVLAGIVSGNFGGNSATNNAAESSLDPSSATTPSVTPSEEPQVAETEEPTSSGVDSPEAVTLFVLSASGQIADMNKDLDDMVKRASNEQLIRLSGNYLELSFNLGQLESLTPPTSASAKWSDAMVDLESSLDRMSTVLGGYVDGTASLDQMLASIEDVRAKANAIGAVAASVG